jgi:thioesterase domain-containing protein
MLQIYPGRAVLLRSKEGTMGDCDDDSERGWTGMLAGGLEIHEVPGDHMTMLKEPQVRKVAERLSECLRKAQLEAALPDQFGWK